MSYLYGPILARRHVQTPRLAFSFALYNEERYTGLEANSRDLVLDADFSIMPSGLHKEILFEDSLFCSMAVDGPYKRNFLLT